MSHLPFTLLHKIIIYEPLLQTQVSGCVSEVAQDIRSDLRLMELKLLNFSELKLRKMHLVTSDTHSLMLRLPSAGPACVLRAHM